MSIQKMVVGCVVLVLQFSAASVGLGDGSSAVHVGSAPASVLIAPQMQNGGGIVEDSHVHHGPTYSGGYSSRALEQGFSPYPPSGPSGVGSLLGYMQCDPHSCPQVWAGYEAQRQADLSRRCSPHGHCGGCGNGCGACGSHGCGSACNTCGGGVVKNRYRHRAVVGAGCSECDAAPASCGCDATPVEVSAIPRKLVAPAMASVVSVPSLSR